MAHPNQLLSSAPGDYGVLLTDDQNGYQSTSPHVRTIIVSAVAAVALLTLLPSPLATASLWTAQTTHQHLQTPTVITSAQARPVAGMPLQQPTPLTVAEGSVRRHPLSGVPGQRFVASQLQQSQPYSMTAPLVVAAAAAGIFCLAMWYKRTFQARQTAADWAMAATVDGGIDIVEGGNPSRAPKPVKPWATMIQETMDKSDIKAFRVRHILVADEETAAMTLKDIKAGLDFEAIAGMLSTCEETKAEGGEIGWVTLDDEHGAVEDVLPMPARAEIWEHKPGDVFVALSERGAHLIKVDDVMMHLSASKQKRGVLPGIGAKIGEWSLANPKTAEVTPTYHVLTMGCQMNVADSERMAGVLEGLGYKQTDDKDASSLLVINTCTIRDHAEQKVYSALGPHAARKRNGEDVGIVVAGCVAQQEGSKLLRRVPEVDLVMGPQYVNRLGDLLEEVGAGAQVVATDPALISEDISKPRRGSTTCAWVNIIYGCNEHCTYCVVPGVRGVEQSRPRESIRKEIEELAAAGYREITLLGQNIDAYGRDMNPRTTFADLLHYVHDVPGIERIKFVTSHPRYMSERVVDAVASLPSLCEVFFVPFQSGDDTVLKRMRRGYSVASYMKIIDRIKRLSPEAAICGDVIVGFPGETDEQFENTMKLIREVEFDTLNTYAYSPRPNTEAALWDEQVDEETKNERLQKVMRLATEMATKRSQRYANQVVEVLVEERNIKQPDQVMGRNRQNRPVFFPGDIEELRGKLVPVRITEVRPYSLTGVQEGDPY